MSSDQRDSADPDRQDITITPPSSASNQGIDIQQALDILASRASHDHSHSHDNENNVDCQQGVTEESKTMGQIIDLNAPASTTGTAVPDPETVAKAMEEQKERLDRDRKTREEEIRSHLQTMSVKDLLQAVLEAQRERVATYRSYDSGLDTVLQTGNMTEYPSICARATASFSVLSDTINTISSILKETHKRSDLVTLLSQLQKEEQNKLNLTAALHLERMRQRSNVEMNADSDERTNRLLQDGVASLRGKLATCIDSINETLEEIRYDLADEGEA